MKTKNIKLAGIVLISALFLQSCMADLRTKSIKKDGVTTENINKGKELLNASWKKQGFDKLGDHEVYSFNGTDTWKGMMGRMGKVWSKLEANMSFKYEVGTFEGQVAYLNGKKKGEKAGLQNWNYYEISSEKDTIFKKMDKRVGFGVPAFQYFTEMIGRLKDAPIITYAGEDEMRGQNYDLVFCTWNTVDPHKEADQYVAWINQSTGLMDFAQFIIRENYLKMPGGQMMYGGIEFTDFKDIDGVKISHKHLVYAFDLKTKQKKFLHRLVVSDFQFDSFDVEDLRPDKKIAAGGDHK